jgi:hypothetical protein
MNGQRKTRKHPLIRLIRGILRLARLVFGSRRASQSELAQIERARQERLEFKRVELERARLQAAQQQERVARDRELAEKYITVGALLDRVQWQFPEPMLLDIPAETKAEIRPLDVSRN